MSTAWIQNLSSAVLIQRGVYCARQLGFIAYDKYWWHKDLVTDSANFITKETLMEIV